MVGKIRCHLMPYTYFAVHFGVIYCILNYCLTMNGLCRDLSWGLETEVRTLGYILINIHFDPLLF